jgi:hypothetical protein
MHHRLLAILAILCFAFGGGGCASKSRKEYDEVRMPLRTGSYLQRHLFVRHSGETKKKPKKKAPSAPKPEAEASATLAPEEESTPPPERFR